VTIAAAIIQWVADHELEIPGLDVETVARRCAQDLLLDTEDVSLGHVALEVSDAWQDLQVLRNRRNGDHRRRHAREEPDATVAETIARERLATRSRRKTSP
jgi:hypothetical protein